MNRAEAIEILERELSYVRQESYDELVARLNGGLVVLEREGPSGATYQLEIEAFWDHRPGGNIRVLGSIDDGGWSAFKPLTRGFLRAPDGSFVGE